MGVINTELERLRERVAELEASGDRSFAIIDTSVDGIVFVDDQQTILLFNQGAEETFGYRGDEILGKSLSLLVPESFQDAHRNQVRKFGESGETHRRMNERGKVRGLRKNGEEFPAEASISTFEQDGKRYYSVIVRDTSIEVICTA